jgi:hypothetical protein
MTTLWRFSINGTYCEEPIGWDAVDITIQRSINYHGLENIFSDNITFWGDAADLISAEYEQFGIDADLDFVVEYSCDSGNTYIIFITGILNCFFYQITNNEVTVKIEPSGLHRKVKNRLDTPINLLSNTSIGGTTMSGLTPFDLGLHSKAINKEFKYEMETDSGPLGSSITSTIGPGLGTRTIAHTRYMQIGFDSLVFSDLETYFNIPSDLSTTSPAAIAAVTGGSGINVNFKITVNVGLNGVVVGAPLSPVGCDPNDFIPLQNATFIVYLQVGATIITLDTYTTGDGCYINVQKNDWVISYNNDFVVNPDDSTEIRLWVELSTNSEYQRNLLNSVDITYNFTGEIFHDDSFIDVTLTTVENPSTAKAFLIYEMFNICSESITDEVDSFRSDFFGRTNSTPYAYPENGCGAWTACTNGLNIRKMLDKSGVIFPIVTTFNDLFQAADAVWNLGMKIERDNVTGKEYIRVEPKEFFYNAGAIASTLHVSDLKRFPAQDLIYNTYKVGYDKWNLNITGTNAIDEYNSVRNFIIPVEKANKNLTTTSKYIASGYIIEETRRIQYQTNPTNDFETDNDMFFICVNPAEVTSDLYTTPPVNTTYDPGTVSERDENFTAVTNVLNHSTSYNLRISPIRMALNWYKVLVSSIFKSQSVPIKFVSGQGNYQEGDTLVYNCIISGEVVQSQNLLQSQLTGENSLPIYLPEYIEFTYPLSYSEFVDIVNNSEKAIYVSCGSVTQYIGFIKELKYSPITQGGIAAFKLIRGQCISGDYNDDFNDDFSVGNC